MATPGVSGRSTGHHCGMGCPRCDLADELERHACLIALGLRRRGRRGDSAHPEEREKVREDEAPIRPPARPDRGTGRESLSPPSWWPFGALTPREHLGAPGNAATRGIATPLRSVGERRGVVGDGAPDSSLSQGHRSFGSAGSLASTAMSERPRVGPSCRESPPAIGGPGGQPLGRHRMGTGPRRRSVSWGAGRRDGQAMPLTPSPSVRGIAAEAFLAARQRPPVVSAPPGGSGRSEP